MQAPRGEVACRSRAAPVGHGRESVALRAFDCVHVYSQSRAVDAACKRAMKQGGVHPQQQPAIPYTNVLLRSQPVKPRTGLRVSCRDERPVLWPHASTVSRACSVPATLSA